MKELDEAERIDAAKGMSRQSTVELYELSQLIENDGLRFERLLDIEEEINGL